MTLMALLLWITGCGTEQSQSSGLQVSSNVAYGEDDYKKIIAANNHLGFQLLSKAEKDKNGNLFVSPMSLYMALSMVYNGADGETKEEISQVLQVHGMDATELNKANASLLSSFNHHSKSVELNVANSIWLNNQFHFQKDFAQNNKDYFNAKIQAIDIADSVSSSMINDWVKKSTNDKIKDIVEEPLSRDLVAILINAIYFKGDWTYKFNKKQTEKRAFTLEDGTQKEKPLMMLDEKLSYFENNEFQAISLPYGNEEMSMKIFLPKEGSSLEEFELSLTTESWKEWNTQFYKRQGVIRLPKFQLQYEAILNDVLKNLGMPVAFTEDANFRKMIQEDETIMISEVKQKTFLDVNEEGTEAAAATSVSMETTAAPTEAFYMEVNRPFFMAITDDVTGAILFLGEIANPIAGD